MLPAKLCRPISDWLGWDVVHVGTRYGEDREIFMAARAAAAVVMTKDMDFVLQLERLGPPPQVIWLTCGNCSNLELERILRAALPEAAELIQRGEPLVEITGAV